MSKIAIDCGTSKLLAYEYDYSLIHKHIIDIHIFVEDKDIYMYYAKIYTGAMETICGVKMKSPYEVDMTTHVELIKPGYIDSNFKEEERVLSWETYREMYQYYGSIVEGPFMIKNNGKIKYFKNIPCAIASPALNFTVSSLTLASSAE